MNFRNKSIFILFSVLFSVFTLVSSTLNEVNVLKNELDSEKIKRHVEIRKELEKEATPFLEHSPEKYNLNLFNINFPVSKDIKDENITWMEYFSNYSFVDFVMGIFSMIALGLGTTYMAWRLNPFADKIEK